jgi:hydrogenase maturation protein HypF
LIRRLHGVIRGAVQGVGFRPFVYRLARELALTGWVQNTPQGVLVEADGPLESLNTFVRRLASERPPRSFIQSFEFSFLDPAGTTSFDIRPSETGGEKTALVMPDLALCDDCLRELLDPADRRYRYPFINCTNCGPRFSIITALPYDRPNTTMRDFVMCPACRHEYEDPLDRRFHAQPNACPDCGPQLESWNPGGAVTATRDAALSAAAELLRAGKILAIKGIGGFHLMTPAADDDAVRRLRRHKHREEKPFALMFPSLEQIRTTCAVDEPEERLLRSGEAPIVLLRRLAASPSPVCDSVAPGNPSLGVMLPYAPLHHLLLRHINFPVVATSGNRSDEPICTDERAALRRLGDIADLFLVHNRPITRHVDDSIVRVLLGRELVLRRARGYAPLPVMLPAPVPDTLAVGAHLKNTVALARGSSAFISQHIGDLETPEAYCAFTETAGRMQTLFDARPAAIVSDLHPDYLSSSYARTRPERQIRIQHHVAHIAACMAENQLADPVLGVAWDGTGLGTDGTIWGGEWILAREVTFRRIGALRTFRLPGGDRAVREPRRSALGVLYELFGETLFTRHGLIPAESWNTAERKNLHRMLVQHLNTPVTSSAGRLFDAVAAIIGLRQQSRYEGQAAMELEFAAGEGNAEPYPFALHRSTDPWTVDWGTMILEILEDRARAVPATAIAARFHATLAAMIVSTARFVGVERVALSGGCFQNRLLTELTVRGLEDAGLRPYWHQRIPPNDGGIALGQIAAAAFTGDLFRQE